MKRMARPECQVCIPESVEQCLACMDEYAAGLEKELAECRRQWQSRGLLRRQLRALDNQAREEADRETSADPTQEGLK